MAVGGQNKPARRPEISLGGHQCDATVGSRHPKPGTDVIKWTFPLKAAGSVDRGSSGENRRETAKKDAAVMIQGEIKGKPCVFTSSCMAKGRGLGGFYGQKNV